MEMRKLLPLIGITISVFIFNMSEFMPIGLLTGIATDFSISDSTAGLIISVYAWAVAILSLPLMLLLRKMEYRRMLLLCIIIFALFQFLSGISTDYGMLMVSRIGVAVAHAVFWSIAAPLAVSVVGEEYRKIALSAVATGTSIAMIAGLPLGRIIGLALGWRSTFMLIAAITVILLVYLVAVFPRVENPGTFTLSRVPDLFRNRIIVGIYIVVIVFVVGNYTAYSYIEPFLIQVAAMSDVMITAVLTVFGFAGILGSAAYARSKDSQRFQVVLCALSGVCAACLLLNPASSVPATLFGVVIIWGVFNTWFNISFQNELIKASPGDAVPITMSLFSGLYNVGIASGSIVGGVILDSIGVENIGFVGGAFVFTALLLTAFVVIRRIKAKEAGGT